MTTTATIASPIITLTPAQLALGRRRRYAPIKADDPQAVEKLKTRIRMMIDTRQAMKDINAALRLKAIVTGNEKLRALGMSEGNIETARTMHGKLFLPWEFQNLGQNIARLQKRLAEIEAEADRAPAEDVEGDGYRVVENTELGRIQMLFDAKPDSDMRSILKRNGFRWAPSQDAWQRHLNENGRMAVQRVRQDIGAA